jgi:hypothetical protein
MGCVLDVVVREDVLRLSDDPAVVAREWPDAAAPAHAAASAISGDVLAEVLQIIFCSLDCEGTRKLASVNKLFRTRSYSAVAVAEFRESQVQLLGFFQSYQVVALRDGRLRAPGSSSKRAQHVADGRRAFVARVEDNKSLSDLAGSVQVLSAFDAASKSERVRVSSSSTTKTDSSVARREDPLVKCGTLKAHDISKGVRLPFNLSLSLRSSLTDRERRLLSLGEAFQKKVLCTFRVGKQHGHSSCSVKCTQCSKYACAECHEAHRCSQCQNSYCADCWEQGSPDMCGEKKNRTPDVRCERTVHIRTYTYKYHTKISMLYNVRAYSHVYIQILTHIPMHAYWECSKSMHACIFLYVHLNVYMYTCISKYVYGYILTYTSIHIHTLTVYLLASTSIESKRKYAPPEKRKRKKKIKYATHPPLSSFPTSLPDPWPLFLLLLPPPPPTHTRNSLITAGICHEPVCSHCTQKQREIRCPTVGATKTNGR